MLRVQLAFEEGRYEDARAAHDELVLHELVLDELRLTYRDRIRLDMPHSRLLDLADARGDPRTTVRWMAWMKWTKRMERTWIATALGQGNGSKSSSGPPAT